VTELNSAALKVLHLLCLQNGEWWEIMVGPGWLPNRLKGFLDEDLCTGRLLLDFDYLLERLKDKALSVTIQQGEAGVFTIQAQGQAAGVTAMWLTMAMASSSLPPLHK
jgi:hypothetical protein